MSFDYASLSINDVSFFLGRLSERRKEFADGILDPLKVDFFGMQKNRRNPFFCGTGLPESLSELSECNAKTPKLFTFIF